jgi:hypothetical protein
MESFFSRLWRLTLCIPLVVIPLICRAQSMQTVKPNAELSPRPAIPAIFAAFDRYEVVAMSEAHGDKDLDDFILSLIRSPEFPEKVNDIAVECGNSLYQPILDRYIAGEKVPFTEVQKVWRNTTQPMCGISEFFEQFFPLVRAINQKLPQSKRLRVLAGDPPIDWGRVKNIQDYLKYKDRDANIASVMEKQVLSKHQKALMLFGEFHDLHGINVPSGEAVTMYEKDYPNVTFVIDDLSENFNLPESAEKRLASWPVQSLALAKGTWLGAMTLGQFDLLPFHLDQDCQAVYDFPRDKPMAELADAFLYLGPSNLALKEPMPADVALDETYMKKWLWRTSLLTPPLEALDQFDQQIVSGAGTPPLLMGDVTPEAIKNITQAVVRGCLEHKKHSNPPQ